MLSPTESFPKKFVAPLPPNVNKVRVRHCLNTRDARFALYCKDQVLWANMDIAGHEDYIDFYFWNKLPEGCKIVVIG